MRKKIISLGVLILFVGLAFAQNNLNAYKYIIVPDKYDAFKEADKYQLNSLTKFLFKKYGFETLSQNVAYPADVAKNPCLAVTAKLNNLSNMFTTKVNIDLIDCFNKVVYSSEVGKSKIKEYKPSFHEAIRNSFVSFQEMDYKYDSGLAVKADPATVTPVIVASPVTPVVEKKESPVQKSVAVVASPAKPVVANTSQKEVSNSIAKSYKNQNISFMLIEQGDKMVAYVKSTNNKIYKNGEKIGTFTKTSLPNVYRVTWKNQEGKFESTTGYIADSGNLKIDVNKNGTIEVVTFEIEK